MEVLPSYMNSKNNIKQVINVAKIAKTHLTVAAVKVVMQLVSITRLLKTRSKKRSL